MTSPRRRSCTPAPTSTSSVTRPDCGPGSGRSPPAGLAACVGTTQGSTRRISNLDGSGVNQDFITGALDPCGVAVDAGHIYWANAGGTPKDRAYNALGRANLDGSGVDQRFVAGANGPCGIAVDG
jgi:hypothetical protein